MDIYDRALKCGEVQEIMGFTPYQAYHFMQQYGKPFGSGRHRAIRQSELRMMQLDGRMAEFVKRCRTAEEVQAWPGRT